MYHTARSVSSSLTQAAGQGASATRLTYYAGYTEETQRLYGVLEIGLKDRDYLAGPGKGVYTIADANAFGWVNAHAMSGVADTLDEWPQVKAWVERLRERPAVQAGLKVTPF
jgi:glutathione S-transferase